MVYSAIAVLAGLCCLVVAYSAAKLLFKDSWVLGWLRGMFGLALLGLAVVFAFVAWDIFSYRQIQQEQRVATLGFEKVKDALYNVVVSDEHGNEQRYQIAGDQWQLDARIIKWKGIVANWGVTPGYRLDRLSGRYYSLEQERSAERTVYSFHESQYGIDVWRWLREARDSLPLVDAVYGSATYLPMADGALFEVSLSGTGLVTRPLNDSAREAVGAWR
ncbi:cation/multidrug efflux pump [uncultured Gilvimarinus sp.]|uniref:cation/multidrug efflux pump n=1 Tax=uncultured Gilvimarinus sp. TaxID=1689143 RepID=UPI0030EB7524|tara:strand:- start:9364 stop:10017 length:654 start_codon:yes stop_codon:yes gene_type:complete